MANPNLIETEELLSEIVRSAKTVAVVGMKGENEADAPAHSVPRALQARGLRIVPVNPKLERTLGEKAHANLASIGARVDIVDVFRRSEAIESIADEVLALPEDQRPDVFWMQTGVRNDEAAEKLARAGIRVVSDRCLSVYVALYRR
jgi:predicted CoA-binding protein